MKHKLLFALAVAGLIITPAVASEYTYSRGKLEDPRGFNTKMLDAVNLSRLRISSYAAPTLLPENPTSTDIVNFRGLMSAIRDKMHSQLDTMCDFEFTDRSLAWLESHEDIADAVVGAVYELETAELELDYAVYQLGGEALHPEFWAEDTGEDYEE